MTSLTLVFRRHALCLESCCCSFVLIVFLIFGSHKNLLFSRKNGIRYQYLERAMWLVLTFGSLFRWIPQPNPLKARSRRNFPKRVSTIVIWDPAGHPIAPRLGVLFRKSIWASRRCLGGLFATWRAAELWRRSVALWLSRRSKSLLFSMILIRKSMFFRARPLPIRHEPQNRYFS